MGTVCFGKSTNMIGNRRLVTDTMSEVYDLLKPWTDQSFWDFSQVSLEPGTIYVFGRQHLLDNLSQIRDLAQTGQYTFVFGNSAEGAWTLETQLKSLRIDQLVREGKILVIAGAEISPEYAHVTHEHFLPRILDYDQNLQAQQHTHEIFSHKHKPYKFLFLNGRARPHRKYMYERFRRSGILDHALWTMLDAKPTIVRSFQFRENGIDVMATSSALQRLPDHYEVDRYREPVFGPINPESSNLKQELFDKEWGEIYLEPAPYVDTYFSLVTETICAESAYSFRTEKIAKPLAMGHPFIVTSNQGFYKDLHDLGFKTFGHVIDETFDSIPNHQERVDRIIQVVTDLCQQDLASFLEECYNVCKYNQQHLAEIRIQERQKFPERFFQFVNQYQ
jgi:hypothetical protein